MHKARTSLSCISDHLIHIKVQRHRTSCNKRRHTHQGFDGRRKFIAKGSSGMELYQPQLLRLYAYSCTDHGMVEMDADGFRMDGYPSFLVYIGICYIRLNRHMGLAGAIGIHFYHIWSRLHDRSRVFTLYTVCFIINIRRAWMDFNSIRIHGLRRRHIGRQQFQINLHIFSRFFCMSYRIRTYHSDSISVLEHFLIAKDGTVPAVSLICGEGNKSGDSVLSRNILVCNDPVYAWHSFRF